MMRSRFYVLLFYFTITNGFHAGVIFRKGYLISILCIFFLAKLKV